MKLYTEEQMDNKQSDVIERILLKYCKNWSVYEVYWVSFIILTLTQILIIFIIYSLIN